VLQDGPEIRTRELISREAAEWFARMQDSRVALDDRRRFLRWLKQSPVHIAEYLAIAEIRSELQRVQLTTLPAEGVAAAPVSHWKIAGAVAALGIAVLLFIVARPAWHERSFATEPGQWSKQVLADGSEVEVGPNTQLQVDVGDARRSIVLARGEAYFKVAKDPARPFFVQAEAFAVRATGTEFAVARRKAELIVTVVQGSVRVAPSSRGEKADERSVPIAAAQQLRIGETWPATPRHVDVRYELAWRERQLMFRAGDTLADAVEEFNVRNHIQLQLDPRVAAVPVRGSFDASDPMAFARIMDGTAPVAIQQPAPDKVRIAPE